MAREWADAEKAAAASIVAARAGQHEEVVQKEVLGLEAGGVREGYAAAKVSKERKEVVSK